MKVQKWRGEKTPLLREYLYQRRKLIAGKDAMVPSWKIALSTAGRKEIYKGKVHILPEDAELEEEPAAEEDTTETME